MALKLAGKGRKPVVRPVDIGGGVTLWVRPAEYSEALAAAERVVPMGIALREGSAAAAEIAELLGDEFLAAQLSNDALTAALEKLALMELVALCCERVDGVLLGDNDRPVTVIDSAVAGLIMRDYATAQKLRAVVHGPFHEVIAEKKESAALRNGEAATPDIAPAVGTQAPPAR